MIKFGYDVITCSMLDRQFVDKIDISDYVNGKKKIVIQVKNTKYIDKDVLRYLLKLKEKYQLDLKISVIGPYREVNAKTNKQRESFFYNTLYDMDELYKIISQFEKIEKLIDPDWDEFDIIVFLVETIVRNIMYDPEYILMRNKGIAIPKMFGTQDAADYYDRSLRGMLTRKAVCAGFAIIFKELANRNGIECRYVNGYGHAWNLVRINGVIYPIDVTRKNTKYRSGDFKNIDDISCDIEEFKRTHRPYDERCNDGLTKIDEEVVKRAREKTVIRKKFNASTYIITRDDKTKFVISQIGMYKGVYRYLYSEIDDSGSYMISKILFSESNLMKKIEDKKFEKSNDFDNFIKSFANVLFSSDNINDSINKNTKYIGSCELQKGNGYVKNCSEIVKSSRAIQTFNLNNIKSKKRMDGSIVTLVQFPNKNNKDLTYQYYIYVLSVWPCVLEYHIFSDTDYFSMNAVEVVNTLLTDDCLNTSISNGGVIRSGK